MNDIDKCSTFIVCHRHLLVKALFPRTTETHGTVSFAVSIHEFSVKGQAEDTVVVVRTVGLVTHKSISSANVIGLYTYVWIVGLTAWLEIMYLYVRGPLHRRPPHYALQSVCLVWVCNSGTECCRMLKYGKQDWLSRQNKSCQRVKGHGR